MEHLTVEELKALLGTHGDDARLQDLAAQIEQARALRNFQPAPVTQAGNLVVANPFGALTGMFVRGRGKQQEAKAMAEREALLRRQAASNEALLRALTRVRPPAPPAATPPFVPPEQKAYGTGPY